MHARHDAWIARPADRGRHGAATPRAHGTSRHTRPGCKMRKRTRPKPGVDVTDGRIRSIATGVEGFDAVLGGGLPELSFNLIAGSPGSGKTTLAQQIVFANATPEKPALYFTVLGEPTFKMLRYQQEFSFFNPPLVPSAIQYLNLSEEALTQDLSLVLDRIIAEVARAKPGIV